MQESGPQENLVPLQQKKKKLRKRKEFVALETPVPIEA